MIEGPYSIYALLDPDSSAVRYVGVTNNPELRLAQHFQDSRLVKRTPRNQWLRKLKAKGKRPTMLILETLPHGAAWPDAERRWIAFYREQGAMLTNTVDGQGGYRWGKRKQPEGSASNAS